MVTTSTTPDLSSTPASCPFCGQPLLDHHAVEHLRQRTAAYQDELRSSLEAEMQAAATARVEDLEKEKAEEVERLKRQLQAAQQHQESDVQQRVADAKVELEQQYGNREKQLEATLERLEEQNAELSRRLERLSAGERGGFNEEAIADELRRAFPDDDVQLTQRGKRGADIFQHVRFSTDRGLTEAGLIIYECKDTLQWSNGFISQMKAEARLHQTPYAILVSRCFPRSESNLAVIDEIVVVEPARVVAISGIMRRMVIESYRAGVMAGSQTQKTAELFSYVSSTEFRQTFDSLAEAGDDLQASLTREWKSHQKAWTERERLYQNISDGLIQIDARFKAILQRTSTATEHRPLQQTA